MIFQRLLHVKWLGIALALLLAGCGGSAQKKETFDSQPDGNATGVTAESLVDPRIAAEFDMGLKALMGGDRKGAEDVFFAMTRSHPDMPGPYANLGMLMTLRKDYQNAEIALKRAMELAPDNAEVYNLLGLLYRQTGRFNAALEIFQRGLGIAPKHQNLLRNTGILLDVYLDMPKQALEHYMRYRALVPDDRQVEIWSASVTARIGR